MYTYVFLTSACIYILVHLWSTPGRRQEPLVKVTTVILHGAEQVNDFFTIYSSTVSNTTVPTALLLLFRSSLMALRAPTLCWAQRIQRQTAFGSSLVGQANRHVAYGESDAWEGAGGLSWSDPTWGAERTFCGEGAIWAAQSSGIYHCCSEDCVSFLLGFPVSFMDPLPGHFPQNCGVTHFVAQLTPLVAAHSLSTGEVWTPQHACGTDPSSPPPQPGSTCISPRCFCSLLGLFLCLGSWPMCTPYLMGTCLFVNTWLKSHLFYETSFNSIFPFRITDLLL